MKFLILLLIPVLSLPLRVALIGNVPDDEMKELAGFFERNGYEFVPSERLESLAKRSSENPSILQYTLAARMLRIDTVYFVKMEGGVVIVRALDVRSGQLYDFSKGKSFLEAFEKGFSKGEYPQVKIGIEGWKEGVLYKKGDLVKWSGKTFECRKVHISDEENAPPNPDFWKRVRKKVVGYFPSWGAVTKSFTPLDVKGDMLTHLHYAFANVSENGECVIGDPRIDLGANEDGSCEKLGGNFAELLKLKKKYPNLKVIISVGGWNWSKNFSRAASSEKSRERLAESCIKTFILGDFGRCGKHPGIFDGIDVDWEFPVSGGKYPGSEKDKENYTLLLKVLREKLDEIGKKTGKRYSLSIAGGSDPDFVFKNTEMKKIAEIVDYVVVMTYDFHGPWSRTGFNANLYPYDEDPLLSVDTVIKSYIKAGVPREKILLGVPFYGRSWEGVSPKSNGLNQTGSIGPGTVEGGVLDYKDIKNRFEKRLKKFFHPKAQAAWLYGGGIFVTYDDPLSVFLKSLYVVQEDLGGVAIWELSCDGGELLSVINGVFGEK